MNRDRASIGCLALVVVLGALMVWTALSGTGLWQQPGAGAGQADVGQADAGQADAGQADAGQADAGTEAPGGARAAGAAGAQRGDTRNLIEDGPLNWSCPDGCQLLPICADGAPIKAYARVDPAGVGARIYYTRADPAYGDLPLDTAAGDLWFCSEGEAQRAGFAPAPR